MSLGTMTTVSTDVVENLYASDLAYLQDFYTAMNFSHEEIDSAASGPRLDAH